MHDLKRPRPPTIYSDQHDSPLFVPAPEIIAWARASFVEEDAALQNPDHLHLNSATIGALWTDVGNSRQGRTIIGQAEHGLPPLGKWQRARMEMQLNQWFGHVPDFVLTFHAPYCMACSDAEFCALVEHELYHCGQAHDQFGAPKFNRSTGMPVFEMRGHDIEEFVGVVSRYGAAPAHVQAFAAAASRAPEISGYRISQVCGTCKLRAA